MSQDKDYILGTHDEEISRLALQHSVWRPRALDAWRRAGFTTGQTLVDVGCGPGWATLDLAEIAGPEGRVVAIDRSRRFLDTLARSARERGFGNISVHEQDLDRGPLPETGADGAWSRWVFAFVKEPRDLLARVRDSLKPGGVLVLHEYFDYSTWRVTPRSPEIEEFVKVVTESWRADGGEPDIGLDLAAWLPEDGFELRSWRPIVEVVPPSSYVWQWPHTFIQVGLDRMVELGRLTAERSGQIAAAFARVESLPNTLMITPGVLELIAVRR